MLSIETYTQHQPQTDHTLASIVHELNNPLTTILGLAEMLLENNASPDHKLTRIRS